MNIRKLQTSELGRPDTETLRDLPTHPFRILVENVRSAHNVGAILRTSDAVRADHVYLTGYTPAGDHRGVHKSALGAQDIVAWSHHDDPLAAAAAAREAGYTIVALEQTDSPTPVSHFEMSHFPICLIVGNEVDGVSQDLLSACDFAIELPQFGSKHSLNVSVAFGVAAYDLLRRWEAVARSH